MKANDTKAMREALCDIVNAAFSVILRHGTSGKEMQRLALCADNARDALAKPPRNCDVGTAEEQAERFILFCRRNSFGGVCNDSCKFSNVNRRLGWQEIGQARCFPFWAQMPYEGGGEKR